MPCGNNCCGSSYCCWLSSQKPSTRGPWACASTWLSPFVVVVDSVSAGLESRWQELCCGQIITKQANSSIQRYHVTHAPSQARVMKLQKQKLICCAALLLAFAACTKEQAATAP